VMPRITTLYEIANALNAELKIALIPRQQIIEFLNEKADKKARQLVSLSTTSSALEIQAPSDEEGKEQIEAMKRDILVKRRNSLWDQFPGG